MKPFDTAELFGCFKAEATERLQKLNEGILALEKRGKESSVLDGLFREAHTLKGAAAMIGHDDISTIAHGFEDILTGIKDETLNISDAVGILFRSCDAIKELLDAEDEHRDPKICASDVTKELERLSGAKGSGGTNNSQSGDASPEDAREEAEISKKEVKASGQSQRSGSVKRPEETIRVAIDKLDGLANTVGEIVIGRVKLAGNVDVLRQVSEMVRSQNKVIGEISQKLGKSPSDQYDTFSEELTVALNKYKESNKDLAEMVLTAYGEQHDTMCRIETIIDRLDSDVTALRMRPISAIFDLFPRIVRDLAKEYEKSVEIRIDGGETELDRTMLEGIKDPLMHLIRNAVDHGIESKQDRKNMGKPVDGMIKLSASQDGYRIFITIEDDGRGIDLERVRAAAVKKGLATTDAAERLSDEEAMKLIFVPGFSTKASVTDVSGRGVGTDVVKKYVEDNLHGQVLVDTQTNMGTRFTLVLPLTLAVTPSVLVNSAGQMFAIPAHSVQLGLRVSESELRSIDGKLAVTVIDSVVPLVKLDETLGLPAVNKNGEKTAIKNEESDHLEIVVVEHGNRRLAFVIDELVEEQDIVVKRLDAPLDDLKFVAGVTVLEKGEIVPILHVNEIIDAGERTGTSFGSESDSLVKTKEEPKRNVLVVEDSLTTRELMKSIIRSAGYNVDTASDGVEAMNKIAESKFDLIVTDIEMPRMDGFEMTQRIKRDSGLKDIPVIIVTALFLDEEKRRGMEVGADAYIKKGDFDQSRLVDTIKRLVV